MERRTGVTSMRGRKPKGERRRSAGADAALVDPAAAITSSGHAARRTHALRVAALRGSIIPAVTTTYAVATFDRPDRAAMLVVSAVLVSVSWSVALTAPFIVCSHLRLLINALALVVHIGGYGMLSHLDGGVTAPLGALVFVSLPFLAISMPTQLFVGFAVFAVATYSGVVLLDPEHPYGYALVISCGYLVVSWLCARYARALVSLRKRLTEVSRIDPLTGCLNRRGFDDHLTREMARADRTGRPMTLVMVDLDSFKAVNDTLGHHVGDELLAWTGRTLQAAARADDGVGRLGGDEFAMILADAGADGATAVVDRLRHALDEVSPASMSFATYPEGATDPEALTRLADTRLYADKATRGAVGVTPETMIAAARETSSGKVVKVSRHEQAAQTIGDLGWMVVFDVAIAAMHLAFFSTREPGALAVTLLVVPGIMGLGFIVNATALARSKGASRVLTFGAPALICFVAASAVLDGGVNSPLAFGMLNSLPFAALIAHWRLTLPICITVSAAYVVIGIVVGAPSGWYMALHLAGILAIAVACSLHGRTAASQRRLLNRLSRVDALTGSFNRRGFEERFDAELARSRRRGSELSLLVLDLDGFKERNDAHGHAAGDELLCWVAETLSELVRTSDVTGRIGGDEFIALLTDCPADRAARIADRISVTMAARIPVSIGATTLGVDGTDFDTLYRHVDERLYAEKGRRKASARAGGSERSGVNSSRGARP